VVADEAYGRQIPFAFLERLRDAFMEKFADRARTAPENSLNGSFGWVSAIKASFGKSCSGACAAVALQMHTLSPSCQCTVNSGHLLVSSTLDHLQQGTYA
jgi:hypothetical protein